MKITTREIVFFIAGILTMLIIESALNWRDNMASFQKGVTDGASVLKKD